MELEAYSKMPIDKAIDLMTSMVRENRPVLIRHHNDCDGYIAGLAIEKALRKIVSEVHKKESDIPRFLKRVPSRTPFYEYSDATRDINMFLQETQRFDRKHPLIIVLDNGSSTEDIMALKKLKMFEVPIIVIDHHPIDEATDEHIDVHINPRSVGLDGNISAGMIACETARRMGVPGLDIYAAISAEADRCSGHEASYYFQKAMELGIDRNRLHTIASGFDFELAHTWYESSDYLERFLTDQKLQDFAADTVNLRKEEVWMSMEDKITEQEHEGAIIAVINPDDIQHPSGWPPRGKNVTILRDSLSEKRQAPVIAIGAGAGYMTFRIGDVQLDFNNIMNRLKEEHPKALITGGGHAKAGSIRFVPGYDLLDSCIEIIKRLIN